MGKRRSFKFLDDDLNRELAGLLRKAKIDHVVDKEGLVHYSEADDEVVENDLICSICDKTLPSWKVFTCPGDWIERYRDYLRRHGIPYQEELSDGELWFLIPRKCRPYAWKLDGNATTERRQVRIEG
jgi:hypothetical protein